MFTSRRSFVVAARCIRLQHLPVERLVRQLLAGIAILCCCGAIAVPSSSPTLAAIPARLRIEQAANSVPVFESGTGSESPSPSGRYLATHWRNLHVGTGLYVYDSKPAAWYRLSDHANDNALLAWLPDESGMIVSYGWRNQQHPVTEMVNHFTWVIYRLTGEHRTLTDLSNCVEWALIPDGSGIVATVMDEKTRERDGNTEARFQVKVFKLATRQWRDCGFHSNWFQTETIAGNGLALRRKGPDWILSFCAVAPMSKTYWVNLSSGKSVLVDDANPPYTYSPNGQYAINVEDNVQLYKATAWPQPTKGGLQLPGTAHSTFDCCRRRRRVERRFALPALQYHCRCAQACHLAHLRCAQSSLHPDGEAAHQ